MQNIIDQDILLAEDIRLIKRLDKVPKDQNFPEGLRFAYQYLIFRNNEWLQLCRIDNYEHDKRKTGTHIHKYTNENVEFKEMDFRESEEYIKQLGERLKRIS